MLIINLQRGKNKISQPKSGITGKNFSLERNLRFSRNLFTLSFFFAESSEFYSYFKWKMIFPIIFCFLFVFETQITI